MKLDEVLAEHAKRRQEDPGYIMTAIFKKATPSHRTRAGEDDTIVALDPNTKRLLFYENDRSNSRVYVDLGGLSRSSSGAVSLRPLRLPHRHMLPEVLALYNNNFDWRDMRQDFIKGILESSELMYEIYVDIIDGEYAARVRDLYTYNAVSTDIIRRWPYPLVPDNNLFGSSEYRYNRGNIYCERSFQPSRSCHIGSNTMVGAHTTVGNGSRISGTIIGHGCQIGKNVLIRNSFLWDNVLVDDDSIIDQALVCSDVHIFPSTRIEPGCVLSFGVSVGPDITPSCRAQNHYHSSC